jgi:diguanylate cyclase (GGDEF)-like protein
MTDRLTGLHTHRDGLRGAIDDHDSPCCLVDIDGLIWINDQYGHEAGDRVLAAVAERLERSLVDYQCMIFRVGGDEFLVLFGSADRTAVREIATQLVSDIRALGIPYRRVDRPQRTVVEVNVAVLPITSTFAERAFSEDGLTDAARKWVGTAVYNEKLRVGRDAGVVVDLCDSIDCPWAEVRARLPAMPMRTEEL